MYTLNEYSKIFLGVKTIFKEINSSSLYLINLIWSYVIVFLDMLSFLFLFFSFSVLLAFGPIHAMFKVDFILSPYHTMFI